MLELVILQQHQHGLEHRHGQQAVGEDRQQDMRKDAGLFVNRVERARWQELR